MVYRDYALGAVVLFVFDRAFELDPHVALDAVSDPFLRRKIGQSGRCRCTQAVRKGRGGRVSITTMQATQYHEDGCVQKNVQTGKE